MKESKPLTPGRIVTIRGGTYDGQGAQIRKVHAEQGYVEVLIAGRIRKLKIERVSHGENQAG